MNEHKAHLEEFENNQRWFTRNFNDIVKKYRDRFVAVWNQKIIDADDNLKQLSIKVKKKTMNAKGDGYTYSVFESRVDLKTLEKFIERLKDFHDRTHQLI